MERQDDLQVLFHRAEFPVSLVLYLLDPYQTLMLFGTSGDLWPWVGS